MKKVKVSRKGRVCRFPHCRNILSIYNHDFYCHLHLDKTGALAGLKSAERMVPSGHL
jgi:hypothetical protein